MGLPVGLTSPGSGPETQVAEVPTAAAVHASRCSETAVTGRPTDALSL